MADGLSDILSVYRESIASERQTRESEMQMALQMLQYDAEKDFRNESRRREDTMFALQHADQAMKESVTQNAQLIYSKFRSLDFIKRDSDGSIEELDVKKAKKLGYTEQEASDIFSMVSHYETEGMQMIGQQIAMRMGRQIAAEYEYSKLTKEATPYLQILAQSGVVLPFDMEDDVAVPLSYEPFVNISQSFDLQNNIDAEISEIGQGDYELQRSINSLQSSLGYGQPSSDDEFEDAMNFLESRVVDESERDDLVSDINQSQSDLTSLKQLRSEGFVGLDDQIKSLSQEIEILRDQKGQQDIQLKVDQVSELADEILNQPGIERNKTNIKVATDQALSILGAEAESSVTSEDPFGLRPLRKIGAPNIPIDTPHVLID